MPNPSLARRCAAMLYDALICIALLIMAEGLLLAARGGDPVPVGNPLHTLYLCTVIVFFFCWFWTHGGETAGMRAWRLRLQTPDGSNISWLQAVLRCAVAGLSWACFGLGFLWSIVDRQNRCWHDLATRTELVLLPKR